MSTSPTPPDTDTDASSSSETQPFSVARVWRAYTGSLLAGTIAILFYKMLTAIATAFANKPVTSDNVTVINLSAAVRTLVMGIIALGTGVFAMAAIGLFLLGGQMILQRFKGTQATANVSSPQD